MALTKTQQWFYDSFPMLRQIMEDKELHWKNVCNAIDEDFVWKGEEVPPLSFEELDKKVNEYIEHYSTVTECKLAKTLVGKIESLTKPMSESREAYLKDELARTNVIMTEINKSWVGWLLLKRIEKKLRKQAERQNG